MGRFVKDVPNAVVYIGLAAAAYYFFVYDDSYFPATSLRSRSEREKYLAATSGQRVRGRAGDAITSRFNTRGTGAYGTQ